MSVPPEVQMALDYLKANPELAKQAQALAKSNPEQLKSMLAMFAMTSGIDVSKIDPAVLQTALASLKF